jgi:hypothetical protein
MNMRLATEHLSRIFFVLGLELKSAANLMPLYFVTDYVLVRSDHTQTQALSLS